MSFELWLSFVATTMLIVAIPGPSLILIATHSIEQGTRQALATISGDLTAGVLQMIAATLGLAAILKSSVLFFEILKWAGAAYLLFLGLQRLLGKQSHSIEISENPHRASNWHFYSRGFLVCISNPKAVFFFATLFPIFLVPEKAILPQFIILVVTFLNLDALTAGVYVCLSRRIGAWVTSHKKVTWQKRISGMMLIGAGLALAAKRAE